MAPEVETRLHAPMISESQRRTSVSRAQALSGQAPLSSCARRWLCSLELVSKPCACRRSRSSAPTLCDSIPLYCETLRESIANLKPLLKHCLLLNPLLLSMRHHYHATTPILVSLSLLFLLQRSLFTAHAAPATTDPPSLSLSL